MSDSENQEINPESTGQQGGQPAGEQQPIAPGYSAPANPQDAAGTPAPQPYAATASQQPYAPDQMPQQPYYAAPQNPYGAPPSP